MIHGCNDYKNYIMFRLFVSSVMAAAEQGLKRMHSWRHSACTAKRCTSNMLSVCLNHYAV